MVAQAVRLDNKAQAWEEEVDLETIHDFFAERQGEAGFDRDGAEENLQVGVGEPKRPLVEDLPEDLYAWFPA